VAELQQRIEGLAREAVPPLILREALGVVKPLLFGSVALPGEKQPLEKQLDRSQNVRAGAAFFRLTDFAGRNASVASVL